jgi:hypothetical protein
MPVAAILSISEQGTDFQWYSEKGRHRSTDSIKWDDIGSAEVFKRDCFAYDLVCLQLHTSDGRTVEFDEEDPDWMELMTALPICLPGCKPWGDWFTDVAFPAFETKLQRVFERNESV